MEMFVILLVFVGGYLTCFVIDLYYIRGKLVSTFRVGYISGVQDFTNQLKNYISKEKDE